MQTPICVRPRAHLLLNVRYVNNQSVKTRFCQKNDVLTKICLGAPLTQKLSLGCLVFVYFTENSNLYPSLKGGNKRIHDPSKLRRQIRVFISKRPIMRRNNWALTSDKLQIVSNYRIPLVDEGISKHGIKPRARLLLWTRIVKKVFF